MVRRRMRPVSRSARFKTASLVVSLDVNTDPKQPAHWVEVRLVFSAPVRAASVGTWVVFLCTDIRLSDAKILGLVRNCRAILHWVFARFRPGVVTARAVSCLSARACGAAARPVAAGRSMAACGAGDGR
jgi:hypothetical protein